MKKIHIIFAISAVFIIVLSSVLIFMAVNNSKGLSASEAEERYNSLFLNEQQMDDEQFTSSLCNLLAGIADGDRDQAEKYATIVRKITWDAYTFEDEEVFFLPKSFRMHTRRFKAVK